MGTVQLPCCQWLVEVVGAAWQRFVPRNGHAASLAHTLHAAYGEGMGGRFSARSPAKDAIRPALARRCSLPAEHLVANCVGTHYAYTRGAACRRADTA